MINETSYGSLKFGDFVSVGALRWLEVVEDWTRHGRDLHFIFYEELTLDPVSREHAHIADDGGDDNDENDVNNENDENVIYMIDKTL